MRDRKKKKNTGIKRQGGKRTYEKEKKKKNLSRVAPVFEDRPGKNGNSKQCQKKRKSNSARRTRRAEGGGKTKVLVKKKGGWSWLHNEKKEMEDRIPQKKNGGMKK